MSDFDAILVAATKIRQAVIYHPDPRILTTADYQAIIDDELGDGSVRKAIESVQRTDSLPCPHCNRAFCECSPGVADPIVQAVQADLDARSAKGIKKYGTTVAGNPGDLRYWLQHAYEEGLDQVLYLKRAMQELDDAH